MLVCIDPGHSGPIEPGAVAAGYTEAGINMAIANALGEQLVHYGHSVIFTRTGNIDDDGLSFRAAIANEAGADIFISIHCNAASSTDAYGVETYCYNGSYQGYKLAAAIQTQLSKANYTQDRGVKEANFAVLRLTDMPAVLIECGFITSEYDRQTLIPPDGQRLIAEAVLLGIEGYSA